MLVRIQPIKMSKHVHLAKSVLKMLGVVNCRKELEKNVPGFTKYSNVQMFLVLPNVQMFLVLPNVQIVPGLTIFNKGRDPMLRSNILLWLELQHPTEFCLKYFQRQKSNSVLFWTPGNSLTTCSMVWKKLYSHVFLSHDLIKIRLNIPMRWWP